MQYLLGMHRVLACRSCSILIVKCSTEEHREEGKHEQECLFSEGTIITEFQSVSPRIVCSLLQAGARLLTFSYDEQISIA